MIIKLSESEAISIPNDLVTPICRDLYNCWDQACAGNPAPSFAAYENNRSKISRHDNCIGLLALTEDKIVINYWGLKLLNWFGESMVRGEAHQTGRNPDCDFKELVQQTSRSQQPLQVTIDGACAFKQGIFEALFLPVDWRETDAGDSPFVACGFGYVGFDSEQGHRQLPDTLLQN